MNNLATNVNELLLTNNNERSELFNNKNKII